MAGCGAGPAGGDVSNQKEGAFAGRRSSNLDRADKACAGGSSELQPHAYANLRGRKLGGLL